MKTKDNNTSSTKQMDAKVMYACLKLPHYPDEGEATLNLIEHYTGLTKWQVFYSMKRLKAFGYVTPDQKKPSEYGRGRKCYSVNDKKHITECGTAWMVEQMINQHRVDNKIRVSTIEKLNPPKKLSRLKQSAVVAKRIRLLRDWKYIADTDETGIIRLCEKAIKQRLYIELVAMDVPLKSLAAYRFRAAKLPLSKTRKQPHRGTVPKSERAKRP